MNFKIFSRFGFCFICFIFLSYSNAYALLEGKLGKVDASASLDATYDSRVFGVSSESFSKMKTDNVESEDDFILKFSPALHFSKKVKWFTFNASAGVMIAQYVYNDKQSYTRPTTTFTIDFDETLAKNRRLSNNAKIRFDATFDIGQSVDASIIEQDLTSYTYFLAGLNVRYNHSPKFGVGAGTSYNYKNYQAGAGSDAAYSDIESLPLTARAFYIYSEKLDFYTNYTFQRTTDNRSGSVGSLIDSSSHSVSFGAQGIYSSKLSGDASIGYSVQSFDNEFTDSQDNLTSTIGLDWKLNTKTNFGFDLSRSFSPSAAGFSMFTTMGNFSVNHRFTDDVSGTAYLSLSNAEFTYAGDGKGGDSSSLNTYGTGFNITRKISQIFSVSSGYNYSYIDRSLETYGRHVINGLVTGRF